VFRKFVFEYIDKFFALEDTEGLHSLTFLLKKVSKNNNGFEDLKVSLSYHFLFPCSAKLAKTCSQHVSLRSNSFELVTEKENKHSAPADVVREIGLLIFFTLSKVLIIQILFREKNKSLKGRLLDFLPLLKLSFLHFKA